MDFAELRPAYVRGHRADLAEVLGEQATVVQSNWERLGEPAAASAVFDRVRWNAALAQRLTLRNKLTATDFGAVTAAELGGRFQPGELDAFLIENGRIGADNINVATEEALQEALASEDPSDGLGNVWTLLLGARLFTVAESTVTTSANFGMLKAAEQSDVRTKRWSVTSRNPRSAHAAMNGEQTPIGEAFSNGMMWPGDPSGGADNNANCRCSLSFEE